MEQIEAGIRRMLALMDFNKENDEDREKMAKYYKESEILTIYKLIISDQKHTTEAWRRKKVRQLINMINIYLREYGGEHK